MAHPSVGTSMPPKLSFAKIAAMPAPNVAPALPNIIRDSRPRSSTGVQQPARASTQPVLSPEPADGSKLELTSRVEEITVAVEGFTLPQTDLHGSHAPLTGASGDSVADDQSQLSTSSFKQQNFDNKSMTSVTTFAMDEKESIRPDDSASVRAVEEDDVHPGLSRNSSFQQEPGSQPQLSKTNVRMLGPSVTITAQRRPYTTLTNPPRFGDLPIGPMPDSSILETRTATEESNPLAVESRPRQVAVNTVPDEKLLEALASVKDRLPLLQLEEKLVSFINNGREAVLELPPQNSFTRLLTHKLADYYNLAHHINDENSSVRIFRAEYCALPVSLAEIARSVPVGSQQLSQSTQFKIMRRAQLGPRQFSAGNSTAASSSVPSKATSENGIETNSEEGLLSPAEGTPSRDRSKLTLAEREAQYKAARERIFGDFQESVTSESGSTGEASASMSRSSSSSGKKKGRKSKTPRDDTFEARSSFIPSYTHMQVQPTYQQVYGEQYQNGYGSGTYSPNTFNGTSSAGFPNYDPGASYGNQIGYNAPNGSMYGPVEGWHNQQQTPPGNFYNYQNASNFQQPVVHPQINNQYMQSSPGAMPQSPGWLPNQYQSVFMQNTATPNGANWQSFQPANVQNQMPYQYGQLPPQNHGSVPFANQHPVPGSFAGTKSLFNPQTRSFVPSNTSARGGARSGRKKGQAPGSARTSGASSPAVSNLSEHVSMKPKEDSLQQKYGTPANLPKKPPPSQVSPHFTGDHNSASGGGPLVVNGNGKSSGS